MRIFNLFPWKWVVRRIAHRKGFLDPFELLARLRRFAQPSEVQEPIELIRAGMVFHARGLVNTKVLQHNLDWIWPYWVNRQFSPDDPSFIPRAFSFSHVNLTHRNWTAVGTPGFLELPIVDPRGLVTPHHDTWSIDHWYIPDEGEALFPSMLVEASQELLTGEGHIVETRGENESAHLVLRSEVVSAPDGFRLRTSISIQSNAPGKLVVAARPCNPEGIQFIDTVRFLEDGRVLEVGGENQIEFSMGADACHASTYPEGDVLQKIRAGKESRESTCAAGLATGAAVFRVGMDGGLEMHYEVPLVEEKEGPALWVSPETPKATGWDAYMNDWARMQIPDTRFLEIFESSKRTLALLSQSDILPGPYTYRRFWFRDACLIGNALLGLGKDDLVRRSLEVFPSRQHLDGYFHSQEGEWDSNGQVLWLADRHERLSMNNGTVLDTKALMKAARWIDRKRQKTRKLDKPHRGLLPAGFSAEHLGPNDFYYWDDFWGAAGLRCAEQMLLRRGDEEASRKVAAMADAFESAIKGSLGTLDPGRVGQAIPAAPTRRMDSGAIGSMVADYPLNLAWIEKGQMLATADWLIKHSLHKGGFFQNMIHSGINAYLTLDLAQTFLRHDDARYWELVTATAAIASQTGKWPEAVHPNTEGGCMGDGEHAWAAAEWCQMMRSLFVMEELDGLLIGKGIPEQWLEQDEPMEFGPTLTSWGRVTVHLRKEHGFWQVHLDADWKDQEPKVKICLPEKFTPDSGSGNPFK